MKNFKVLSNPKNIYNWMIRDILDAKKEILLETYIFDQDKIGLLFKKALIKRAKEGVKIKLLIDSWGSTAKKDFFSELIKLGAEVRYFREFKYLIRIIGENHERNHRKLLIIDNKIVYIGSINITYSCISWRELALRIEGNIANSFEASFLKTWENNQKISGKKFKDKLILFKNFKILNEFPSLIHKITENKYLKLISNARNNIMIESPYFVPPLKIIQALSSAVKRGVKVDIIVPYASDVLIVDLIRERYLGRLHKKGINIHYYKKILHSKLMIVDDKYFLLGSSNLDFRSFNHQFEINFIGKDKNIITELKKYYNQTLSNSFDFDYKKWSNRCSFLEIIGLLLHSIRSYL